MSSPLVNLMDKMLNGQTNMEQTNKKSDTQPGFPQRGPCMIPYFQRRENPQKYSKPLRIWMFKYIQIFFFGQTVKNIYPLHVIGKTINMEGLKQQRGFRGAFRV